MFILVRNHDGKYVAGPGSASSYTKSLRDAWKFPTRDEAERNRCTENEHVAEFVVFTMT